MVLERWQWPPTSNQRFSTWCTKPFKPLQILAKTCLAFLGGKQMTPKHFFFKVQQKKRTKAVVKKQYLHHMIRQILFILFSLLIQVFKHLFTPVLGQKILSSCSRNPIDITNTLEQSFMTTRLLNTSILKPPRRPVYCLFLFWCNIKSSFNDRCCW